MSVFQIWGSFTKDDPDHPTTVSTFRKGQLMIDGTSMEEFELQFAMEEGEDLILLHEFDPVQYLADRDIHEHLPSASMERALAALVQESFMEGWWRRKDGDDAPDDQK